MERFDNLDKFFYDVWYLLIKVVIKWKGDYQKFSVVIIDIDGFVCQCVIVLCEVDL